MRLLELQNYPMFVTNETTSPDLGSPIVSVSTVNSPIRPHEIDEQMERFSETSSIELIIQGGSYEQQTAAAKVPESHTMQFNPYPGAKSGHVPFDIVKSFTPVLTQSEHKHQDGDDIYNDYIQDPYNLTLQIEGNGVVGDSVSIQSVPSSASTIFQSSSYFSNVSDLNSPGSDLFNRP